jgi:heme oxygenase
MSKWKILDRELAETFKVSEDDGVLFVDMSKSQGKNWREHLAHLKESNIIEELEDKIEKPAYRPTFKPKRKVVKKRRRF